jgi:ATP-dependent exoDNAse (exonuclease V) beta subunit
MYTLDGKPLMGVTSVLGVIAKPALIGWAARMAADYVLENLKDMDNLEQVCELAKNAHARKRDEGAEKGTDIHAWIEEWIAGKNPEMPKDEGPRKQIEEFLKWATENKVEFLESEKRMYSEKHWIAGTCDAIAMIDGKKYVVDFKTQSKMWDKTPFLQMAGYRIMLEEMGEKDYEGGCVVLLPKEGGLETHYSYDYDTDKEGFLAALKLYKTLK